MELNKNLGLLTPDLFLVLPVTPALPHIQDYHEEAGQEPPWRVFIWWETQINTYGPLCPKSGGEGLS